MRTRTLPTLLAASLAVGALAFTPATDDPTEEQTVSEEQTVTVGDGTEEDEGPELLGPCSDPYGITITPDAGFDEVVPTPVGTANLEAPTDAALLQVSLEGHEVGTRARVRFTLDWDTPGDVGDYDLTINGANDFSVDQPEIETFTADHCGGFDVKTEVFLGLPTDTLTLTADVTLIPPVD